MNTPKNKISRAAFLDNITTPMIIPPSPQLQKLGYGTGNTEPDETIYFKYFLNS